MLGPFSSPCRPRPSNNLLPSVTLQYTSLARELALEPAHRLGMAPVAKPAYRLGVAIVARHPTDERMESNRLLADQSTVLPPSSRRAR